MWYKKTQSKGRKKGSKNLKRTDGGFVNAQGVFFTPEEKRALENEVRKVNRKRKKMEETFGALPRKVAGQDTGMTMGEMRLMGKESDFILAKKSSSLQRFKSKEEYQKYMHNLERVNDPDYITKRARQYKQNYREAILRQYSWDDAKDILMKIRMMKPEDYIKNVSSNEELELSYLYDAVEKNAKLNQIRAALGLEPKDADFFWDGDEF